MEPRATLLDVFYKEYPDAIKENNGTPMCFCPGSLYSGFPTIFDGCALDCRACWNAPAPMEEQHERDDSMEP